MRSSQSRETERVDLARLDRRTLLHLCATALSTAALAPGLTGCASGPYRGGEVLFREVTRSKLTMAAGEIARTLLGFLEQETSNDTAVKQLDRVLREAGVWDGILAGPVAAVDQVGYSLLVNGGEQGFLTLKVYNDSKFVLPLIVRRGVATERSVAQARAASCCMTEGTSTYNNAGELAVTDSQADDPCLAAGYIDLQELTRQRRELFGLQEVVAYTEVMRKALEVLETSGEPDVTELSAWLAAQRSRFAVNKVLMSARRDGDILWVDWLLIFRNGAAGTVQVAKGKVQPAYALVPGPVSMARAKIDATPAESDLEGVDVAFPRVSLSR